MAAQRAPTARRGRLTRVPSHTPAAKPGNFRRFPLATSVRASWQTPAMRERLARAFGVDGTRVPAKPPNGRTRRLLAVALAAFLVLNVLTKSWVFVVLAALWLGLIVLREAIDRRQS